MAQMWEQQITRNPFIPKPVPLFHSRRKLVRSVRRSVSSPQLLPSQISQSSEIRAVATTQTLSTTPPVIEAGSECADDCANDQENNENHSSPFSISGNTCTLIDFI